VNHPERIVPDATEPGIVALHLKRYEFARSYCRDKDVLDAGCGVGYGAAFLADEARQVLAVDVSDEAIAYARRRYPRPNVTFVIGDVLALGEPDRRFDVICAFETIEHLADPERFVAEARRLLRDPGTLLVSTPRADAPNSQPANPFHEREYTPTEFERLLRMQFGSVDLFGQRRLQTSRHRALQRLDALGLRKRLPFLRPLGRVLTGTSAMAEVTTAEVELGRDLERATELLAVCRG
jgi:SAM-dependent methyltransferase